jgi:hypothetical protein
MVEMLMELHELDHQQKKEKLMEVVMTFEKEKKMVFKYKIFIFTKALHNIRNFDR